MFRRYLSTYIKRIPRPALVLIAIILVLICSLLFTTRDAGAPGVAVNTSHAASSKSCKDSRTSSTCIVNNNVNSNTGTNTAPIGQAGAWNLVFDDEFNSTGLDLTKWILCNPSYEPQSQCLPYNNEQEIYNTSLPSNPNVYVSGGNLNLVATKQNGQIYSGVVSTGPNVFGYNQPNYTGFQFTYGYVEVAVKLPKGDGFWPAVWLLPDENKYGPWPDSGEYDVLETAGNDPSTVYMTEIDGQNASAGDQATDQVSDTSAGYHVFGFDWEPDHLAWYIDGKLARTMICTNAYANANPGVCDSYRNPAAIKNYPFFIIMNLAVGGDWSALNGAPDSSTVFPANMSIDWIHVWQHSTT